MDQKEYQLLILDEMAKNEEKLSKLYALFMQKYPSRNEFWQSLAQEEVGHGHWIRTLRMRVEEGAVLFQQGRFSIDVLNDFYKYIGGQIVHFDGLEEFPLIDALQVSKDVENTMLEKEFFKVFAGDAVELEILLLALEYSTKNHREEVEKALEQEMAMIAK